MFKLSTNDILRRIKVGVDRDDLSDAYVGYLNQAIREIENRCSFSYMKSSASITIKSGGKTVNMPDDFKEVIRLNSPVSRIATPIGSPTPATIPCILYSRQQLERMQNSMGSYVLTSPQEQKLTLMMDSEDGIWFLSLLQNSTEDIDLRVNYYAYSGQLTEDDQEHPLFTYYPNLVVSCTRFMIFSDLNDPQKDESEKMYERFLSIAKGNDRGISFSGFDSHM